MTSHFEPTLLPEIASLLQIPESEGGHSATLHEILQQPATWRVTAQQMVEAARQLKKTMDAVQTVVLTGSGSSEYAGECVRPHLQRRLAATVQTVGSGTILTDGVGLFAPARPAVMISFARSGDSPESVGAFEKTLALDLTIRHLAVTCNREGQLARRAADGGNISAVVLDERTNDRSLVMTSSFTNMVLAACSLGWQENSEGYLLLAETLSRGAEELLLGCFQSVPRVAALPFRRAFYLADALSFGAARESALKMTEMTAGRVMTASETYLGLRHGPMSAVDPETLVVCFLSSDPVRRSYEVDLIEELNAKQLGIAKLLVGAAVPRHLLRENDIALDHAAFAEIGDDAAAILHVVVGQVLAFYRCMKEGLRPDAPSSTGVINRVVQKFRLHGVAGD